MLTTKVKRVKCLFRDDSFCFFLLGLEDQLLGRVIQSEKQELEEMKNEMQESMVIFGRLSECLDRLTQ